jgi:hypothetical protein
MAGLETTHRIVEKIEVTGKNEAKNAFAQLGGVAGWAAKALGLAKVGQDDTSESSHKMADGLNAAGQAMADLAHKTPAAGKKVAGGLNLGKLAAGAFAGAVTTAAAAVTALAWKSWHANAAFDDMNDHLTGLYIGTAKWAKSEDPIARYERSAAGAEATLTKFEATAFKTAQTVESIANLGGALEPTIFAAGKSAWDLTKAVDAAASAAGVLQISNEQAAASFNRMILTGKKTKDPFGMVVGTEAALKKTDSLETRINKLTAAAAKVGAPISKLSQGTSESFTRAEMLITSIARKLGAGPIEKLGKAVGWVVDQFGDGEEAVAAISAKLDGVWDAATVVSRVFETPVKLAWEFGKALFTGSGYFRTIGGLIQDVGHFLLNLVVKPMEIIGLGAKVVVQAVKDWNSPEGGFRKTKTLVDSIVLKMREFWEPVFDGFSKMAGLALPAWLTDKVPVLGQLKDWAQNGAEKFKKTNRDIERDIEMRQDLFGMDPTTESGKRRKMGKSKGEVETVLKKLFGEKRPLINVENVNIKQDFRDQDPDRVLAEFVDGLERLGENSIQSQIAGRLTALGPGG